MVQARPILAYRWALKLAGGSQNLGKASQMTPNLQEVLSTYVETKLVALEFCPAREVSRMIEKSFDFGKILRFSTPCSLFWHCFLKKTCQKCLKRHYSILRQVLVMS